MSRPLEGMRWVLAQVVERLHREGEPGLARRLLTATFVLSGLRLDRNQVRTIFQGVRVMRESDTYQAIPTTGRRTKAIPALRKALWCSTDPV